MKKNIKIIDTDSHKKHGTNKCPNCGASDITYDINSKKLICNFCKTLFEGESLKENNNSVDKLSGEIHSSSLKDIKEGNDVITLKCNNCQAEVVINTKETQNVRCHWCNSILSLNSQVENGVVPDMILPFAVFKEAAEKKIENYITSHKLFADKQFKKEFKSQSIKGVYFPYIIIDSNAHALFKGEAGKVARRYTKVVGKDSNGKDEEETFYDIDLYEIERDFDITIDDLQMESSKDIINKNVNDRTNNIINSIMPFDTKNCIKYKSNYLIGYTSEKRDINISKMEEKIDESLKDIARYAINSDLNDYDAGVSWKEENFDIKGKQILSAYFPVWLMSYLDKDQILHYVAVNGRTGETNGSIPINKKKLLLLSLLLFASIALFPLILYFAIYLIVNGGLDKNLFIFAPVFIPIYLFTLFIASIGSVAFYFVNDYSYRKKNDRHKHEKETAYNLNILNRKETEIRRMHERSSSRIWDVNSYKTTGDKVIIKDDDK